MPDVIVIGGGPAGSAAAAIAARAGLNVVVFEAAKHPRTHVGESLLPGVIPILAQMGALAAVEQAGFTRKTGTTHWDWGILAEWDLWFSDSDQYDHAWLVDRSRFDAILLDAAKRAGAAVHEQAAVRRLLWKGDRLSGVEWTTRGDTTVRTCEAEYIVDASGQAALIARELNLRAVIDGLQHRAVWAHYDGAERLPSPRQGQALFIAEANRWLWMFPLSEGKTSIGIVTLDDAASEGTSSEREFDEIVSRSRMLTVIGSDARRVTPARSVRDWSYRMNRVAGPGWLLAGDASGFIDPVLSTGVFLAMHAGACAARALASILRDKRNEHQVLDDYERAHRALFQDLLRMVRFYYQRNLHRDDYFWESKRILLRADTDLKPQKAFVALTSGLVRNLVLDDVARATDARREAAAKSPAHDVEAHDPERLGFVCFHLLYCAPGGSPSESPAALYLLIEPSDPVAPSLFRTPRFDLNCLAPRYDNDPIRVPDLARMLRAFHGQLAALDVVGDESLAAFWRRTRVALVSAIRALPAWFTVVRIFGE